MREENNPEIVCECHFVDFGGVERTNLAEELWEWICAVALWFVVNDLGCVCIGEGD